MSYMLSHTDPPRNPPEPQKVQPTEAHTASRSGPALLVDVRDARLYDNAHLDRAVSVPLAEIEAAGGNLPPGISVPTDALLILYCA
jgi:rhodanese-related sulfurtransferase